MRRVEAVGPLTPHGCVARAGLFLHGRALRKAASRAFCVPASTHYLKGWVTSPHQSSTRYLAVLWLPSACRLLLFVLIRPPSCYPLITNPWDLFVCLHHRVGFYSQASNCTELDPAANVSTAKPGDMSRWNKAVSRGTGDYGGQPRASCLTLNDFCWLPRPLLE